jgi:hypothetical protein
VNTIERRPTDLENAKSFGRHGESVVDHTMR